MSKVLIVDDVAENLYFLRTVLVANGYEVETAHNGAEALSVAHSSAPDLIISDLLMPVMDGFSLCHAWHSDPRLSDIPFVVYTATYTDPADRDLALQAGADLFLLKPQEPHELTQAILELIQKRKNQDNRQRRPTADHPEAFLRNYNAALVRKLEDKLVELETSNRRLVEEASRQQHTLDALRQSEERFSKIFRLNPIPIAIAKLGGGIVDLNDALLQKFGITLEEALGRTGDELGISVEPAAKIREEFRRAGYRIQNRETQYRDRLGHVLTFLLSAELVHIAGEPHIIFMGPDITEQKRQQELGRILSSAVTNASDAIVITDNDLDPTPTVLYINPAFTRLTGFTAEELVGRKTSDTFGAGIASDYVAAIQRVLSTGNAFHGEVTNHTKDGRLLYLELDIVPVRDRGGAITHFVSVRRDISRRKAEELNRQQLLRLVFEAQTEERRRISRELHDNAGQLLTSMLLRLNVLQEATADQTAKRALQELCSVASTALEDISRLARGLHPAVLEDLGLAEAIRRSVEELGSRAVGASFNVIGRSERLPQHVEREIYQIVKEALTNVQKHSRADRVEVSLQKAVEAVTATIRDNGIGFDPSGPAAGRAHLGMVGMKERATLLGGSLLVTSAPGEGTTVMLTVPLVKMHEAPVYEQP